MNLSGPVTLTQGSDTLTGTLEGFQREDDGITYLVFVPRPVNS